MGSFLFKWSHPAKEVYVTGTFDDWARSVKLEHKGTHFEKLVELPHTSDKIYYKFVVDDEWITDHTAPQETDSANNVNNVLFPENISSNNTLSGPATTGIMSGVTPQSTTAGLAGKVPKEAERAIRPESASSDVPGSFPETPYHEASEYAVDPIPATSGIGNPVTLQPGEKVPKPDTLTSNTISSTVRDDPALAKSAQDSEQTFGVAPLPATSGIGNPVSLQPGDKVPHPSSFTQNTINSNVTTDKASYENSTGAPQLPSVVTPDNEREAKGGLFSVPGISKNIIPESSLPMGGGHESEPDPGVTIQSAGPQSTTAALAAKVPLEPRGVPEVVQDSQEQAGSAAEASDNTEAIKEKTADERELQTKVSEEPAASEGTSGRSKEAVTTAGAEAIGGAAAITATASRALPASVQKSIDELNTSSSGSAIAPTVPDTVQESIAQSHQSPEAAGSEAMVSEKNAVEQELLKEVPKKDDLGEPAPSASAALTDAAPKATGTEAASTPNNQKNPPSSAAQDPAAITTAAAPAQTPATQNSLKQAVRSQPDSRDISPMSKPINPQQTQPSVTTGVGASSAPTTSTPTTGPQSTTKTAAPVNPSPASNRSAATSDKKSKRASGFFGKLKSKFSDKDKK